MNNLKITAIGIALVSLLVFTTCKMEVSDPIKANIGAYISENPASTVFWPGTYSVANPPKLEAKTWDWDSEDGELYYQWFKFESIAEYLENDYKGVEINAELIKGEEDAEGKTISSHTLDITSTAPGKIYYYYVEVTNIISNGKEADDPDYEVVWTSKPVRSEIAAITFASSGEGEYPVISRQPASATYVFGSTMSQLGFKLKKLSAGSELSYQWYIGELDAEGKIKTESGKPKGTEVSDATLEYLLLLPRTDAYTMNLKDNFFWVEITNTPQSGTPTTVTTIPAKITLNPAARAQAPRILKQPGNRLYLTGDAVAESITFSAESTDFGELSFQWYSNTVSATTGGTPIDGADKMTYALTDLTVSTATAPADFYYYVVVTNTNENVTGTKTASLTSKIAQVSVRAASGKSANARITIENPALPENRYNYVRGYGGMSVAWANFPEENAGNTETMYNPDIMGFNIMRIMIPPSNTNIEISMNDLTQSQRPDYYESVRIVNKYGGYVLASPWSPPKEWKSNNSINGGGNLMPRYYRQFANYLRSFAQHMYDRGAPIYAISIANEPNYVAGYDGCEWTPNEMRDFYIEVGHFTNGVRGFGGGVDIPTVLTVNGESANTPHINDAALENDISRSVIDLYARHVYGRQTETLWDNAYATWEEGDPYETECWMTEHNINSANANAYKFDSTWPYVWRFMNDIDLVMRINNENAFVWWASKRFYSMLGDGQNGANEGTPLPRGWGLSHYAKYTIDTRRIRISVSGTNKDSNPITQGGSVEKGVRTGIVNSSDFHLDNLSAKITAYVSRDGNEITMVMWTPTNPDETNGTDMGTIEITMPGGFTIGDASAVRSTSADSIMVPELPELNSTRNKAYIDLGPAEIVSVRFTRK
jgi:O-glycosyl hydrolase